MRRTVTLVIALAVCLPLSACGSSSAPTTSSSSQTTTSAPPPSPPPSSPRAELAAMRRAASGEHSVHYVSVSSAPGHTIRIVADIGAQQGIQRITVTDHGQTGSATAIVTDGYAFMRGDAFAMRVYFGFTQTQATKYAGKWISVPSSHPAYASISDDVTLPSFLSHLFAQQTKLSLVKNGGLVGVRGTVHGQGRASAVATLFAPSHGKPLPVRQNARSSGKGGTGVVSMSDWNEAVHVKEPTALSITTVLGG